MKYLALVLLLSGCNSLYPTELPEGMELTETHYTSSTELRDVCGASDACAFTNHSTFCDIHLPLAANGEVIERYRIEEIGHCIMGHTHPVASR